MSFFRAFFALSLAASGVLATSASPASAHRYRHGLHLITDADAAALPAIGLPDGAIRKAMLGRLLSGTHVRVVTWNDDLETLAALNGRRAPFDLLYIEDSTAALACRNGLLTQLPTADPAMAQTGDTGGPICTRPAPALNLVLAWDSARIAALTGWSGLWDLAQHPGRRGLRRDPRGTLEIALLADGVAPGDVYRVLSTPDGVDRAFRRLDQLKPYIAWWDTPAQAVALLESGGAIMTAAPAGEIIADAAARRPPAHRAALAALWSPSLLLPMAWALPAGLSAQRVQHAQSLLARVTEPARVAAFHQAYPDAPVAAQPDGDGASADEATRFWLAHYTALRQRFDAWLTAK